MEVKSRFLLVFAFFVSIVVTVISFQASAQTPNLVDRSALRVCADPANMPFSNERLEGFENKIAALLGEKLNLPVVYTWYPQATGFVRRTLHANRCDIIMGYVQGHELVLNTNPYYRSVYVMAYVKGRGLDGLNSLQDTRLKSRKIGIIAGTPPSTLLALNRLLPNVVPFQLVVDRRFASPAEDMMAALDAGRIDLALLWGPIGGYLAQQSTQTVVVKPLPLLKSGPRLAFRITFGVRRSDVEWKHQLNDFIATNQAAIRAILSDYGVPLLDENDQLVKN